MTIIPIAPIATGGPNPISGVSLTQDSAKKNVAGARVPTVREEDATIASPLARVSPTLPAGVSFIEEPSGIKIYVNNEQVQSGTLRTENGRTEK